MAKSPRNLDGLNNIFKIGGDKAIFARYAVVESAVYLA